MSQVEFSLLPFISIITEVSSVDQDKVPVSLRNVQVDPDCLYMDILLNKGYCSTLIDTGSPISLIYHADFRSLGFVDSLLVQANINLTISNGKDIDVKGQFTVQFSSGC